MSGHHHPPAHGHHHPSHDHRHAPGGQDWGGLGTLIELEAEVMMPFLDEAVSILRGLAASGPEGVRRIADIGSGPGVATTALATAFPDAALVALDGSAALLTQVQSRAARLGVSHRLTTIPTNLDEGLGALGEIDVAWAAMVLHHLPEPASLLRELHGLLAPGGLVAIAEFGPPPRTLPEDIGFGAPGFARRYAESMAAAIEAHLPAGALHIDWRGLLKTAGFTVVADTTILVDLPAPLPEPARRFVALNLQRSAALLKERLSEGDLATLAILADQADPRGAMHRTDIEVHAGRSFYVGRKARGAESTET